MHLYALRKVKIIYLLEQQFERAEEMQVPKIVKWRLEFCCSGIALRDGITMIGNSLQADIRSNGLKPIHAIIYKHKNFIELSARGTVKVNGLAVRRRAVLFRNDKIELTSLTNRSTFYVIRKEVPVNTDAANVDLTMEE